MSNNENNSVEVQENVAAAESTEGRAQHQPTKLESFFAITKSLLIRALIVYFITSYIRRSTPSTQNTNISASDTTTAAKYAWNMFPYNTVFDLYIYVSEDKKFSDFDNLANVFWIKKNLVYGNWTDGPNQDGIFTYNNVIPVSDKLRNNGSIYLHAYVVPSNKSPNPRDVKNFPGRDNICYISHMLNKYKKKRYQKTKNLLTGESEQPEEDLIKAATMKEEIVSHWHPNLTLNIVTDQTNWMVGSLPPPFDEVIEFVDHGRKYKPIVFANDFWNMQRDYKQINESTNVLHLYLSYQPISLFKYQMYSAQSMRNKWMSNVLGDSFTSEPEDDDQDTLKETLMETSIYLLVLTFTVSILHSIFEILAFKNDIQFWNNRKSLEGLSVRSIFFNVVQSLIVLLYVFDNETNMLIRISCFVGLAIEVWKINKVIDLRLDNERKLFGLFPRIVFQDKGSYVESSTKEYDIMAFKYLSWCCFPLLGCYAVYSLFYQEHKGWYSFILNILYGYLLTFGFIMMTPQLFINYKLKSVAHLPWRMMTYKFLNTFIDDIFAFVIKMPTMYRIGCFRDDIIFFVFLYQRWIYKVDATRINEFGFSAEMLEEAKRETAIQNGDKKAIEVATPPQEEEKHENKKNI